MHRSIAVPTLVLLIVTAGHAQSPAPATFDVASVKTNRSAAPFRMGPVLQPGGRVMATNVTLRDLVRVAFAVEDAQLVGGPDWIDSDRFDLDARGPADLTPPRGRALLRQLLADRFKLATHAETRELPIYRLVLSRRDRALGPKLKASGPDCAPITPPAGVPLPPPPPPGAAGVFLGVSGDAPLRCGTMMIPGGMSARTITMPAFGNVLSYEVDRPVVDATGLGGAFDLDLTYTPDLRAAAGAPPASSAPSLFTALEEQLGLKLEAARGPVDVVVIDRAERPADN